MNRIDLVVFDLDGTLAESKSAMDSEMAGLVRRLLEVKKMAVISGGGFPQFEKQFVKSLRGKKAHMENLFLFPTTANSFFRYRDGKWKQVYAKHLEASLKKRIYSAFEKAFQDTGYVHPKKRWGTLIEDRGTQLTFSALGQKAPVYAKKEWNKNDVRPKIMKAMKRHLSGLEVRSGGLTSIDVTKKGIDKAFGIRQIEKYLKIPRKHMLFVGDALFPGGNDYPAKKTGVKCVAVKGPEDTKRLIKDLIKG